MLKKHKNALVNAIESAGINMHLFTFYEKDTNDSVYGKRYEIALKNSQLSFSITTYRESYKIFRWKYVLFAPEYPFNKQPSYGGSEELLNEFQIWLNGEVLEYLREENLPDLWAEARSGYMLFLEEINWSDGTNFDTQEKQEIKASLDAYRAKIIDEFQPSDTEKAHIDDRFKELDDALERTNKIDWKNILIGQIVNIGIIVVKENVQWGTLWKMANEAFNACMKMLPT
jgi:hypothetical protein